MEEAYEAFATTESCQFWPVHHSVTVLKKVECLHKPPNELEEPWDVCSLSQRHVSIRNAVPTVQILIF